MLHKNRVFEKIGNWHNDGIPMVLACVVGSEGSTYSKPGDFIVISATGDYQGLVSGGCVEGDLAERARQALDEGQRIAVTYDLGGEHDALWGMGAGCDGTLHIWLTPIRDAADAEPLLTVKAAYEAGEPAGFAIARPDDKGTAMLAIVDRGRRIVPASAGADAPSLAAALTARTASGQSGRLQVDGREWFAVSVSPAPQVLILGAAPDAEPLCQLLSALGWSMTVYDHRPAYIDQIGRLGVARLHCAPAAMLADELDLTRFDAVVIMSHHLASDERYLAAVSVHPHWHYVGVLGPRHRRERLVAAIGGVAAQFAERMHGPAGLDIGAREPASIALSIVAQMQQELSARGRI